MTMLCRYYLEGYFTDILYLMASVVIFYLLISIMLRIHLILMQILILDPTSIRMNPDFKCQIFHINSSFFLYFFLKLDNYSEIRNF